MAFSLYSATVPTYRQMLESVAGLLVKAETYCTDHGMAPPELIQARLAADMLPFAYQVKSTVAHSRGAIEGVRKGSFSPDMTPPPETFTALKTQVADALTALAAVTAAEMDACVGRDMLFVFGERRMQFTAEDFLLSFSMPNFYFHATTAYDILRWKGLPLGKRDYMGKLRLKS
jgi:uncharacterized protein